MVVLSMCSRRRCDAFLDDLYWKPRYLAVFPPPCVRHIITCTASYHTWQNMYRGRWQLRRRNRRIEGDACAMGLRLGAPLALYVPLDLTDPPAATPWRWPGLSRSVEVMQDDGSEDWAPSTTSGPRHGLVTVRSWARSRDVVVHDTRQLRYFVEESGSEEGPDRGEIDVSVWLSDVGDIAYIRVHTSDGVLHDPDRPEVGRRRIRVGSTVSDLLQAYGLGADDVSNLALDRFGPIFELRGVRGLRFGVAGEIEDEIPEKEELLDERLVSIHVKYARHGNEEWYWRSML